MSTTDTAIRTTGLGKTFKGAEGPVTALDGVDVTINTGEIVALLGPNGAGKTTLIDLVLGLTKPTKGTVEIFGTPPGKAINGQRIGAVMQTGGLLPDVTVEGIVKMIASTLKNPRPVDDVLGEADLIRLRTRLVGRCSGGEQQRIRFALALLGDPDLLILDEPTTGMDATARHDFWESMRVQADQGITIVFATHYLEEAQNFAQRIVLLDSGGIIADGTPSELQKLDSDVVVEYDLDGTHYRETTEDSDALARRLLTTTDATDLRINSHTLEDTFIRLTRKTGNNGSEKS
ncbi:MAG: ABC transporter ATP-binding protein [Mycobacteriaceae bacterium]|uniref:ABC transporter ATP-binding protein n=1 Tax=Corynebacterium sp. TaxID=1720 RepID=UPI003F9C1AF1